MARRLNYLETPLELQIEKLTRQGRVTRVWTWLLAVVGFACCIRLGRLLHQARPRAGVQFRAQARERVGRPAIQERDDPEAEADADVGASRALA